MAYDEAKLMSALRNADAAGDMEAATRIAGIIRRNREQPDADPRKALAEAAMAQYPVPSNQELAQRQALSELAAEQGPLDSFLIGAGKGFYNIGRGLGLADQADQTEQEAYAALERQRPYATGAGEIVGESSPFIVPGLGAGKIAATLPRAAAMAGIGASQGAIGARGRGEDATTQVVSGALAGLTAGTLELALPYIGRVGGALVRRVTGKAPQGAVLDAAGRPTAELQDALAKAGLNYDDLAANAMRELTEARPGTNPEQLARSALFAEEGIPATRGAITKDFGQQTVEARLADAVSDPAAAPFRGQILRQSEAIKGRLDDLVEKLGVPERAGESLKEALSGQKQLLKSQKSALYKEASELAKDSGGLPFIPDNIRAAIPDENMLDDLAITAPSSVESLNKALVKYGIKDAPENYSGKITPLTVENFESFRKVLNSIDRGDQTGAASVAIRPIRDALDNEMDLMSQSVVNPDIATKLRDARRLVREEKTEFSPNALAGRLINAKPDGVTPIIEASQAADRLFSKATPVEQIQKTLANLSKSDKGKQAIGDLQAAAVLRLMDDAFGASSRQIDGVKTFGPGAFQSAVEKIGQDKLNLLFSSNKDALARIRNIEKISAAIQTPTGAVPKGSASTILDLTNRLMLNRVPGIGPFVDLLSSVKASSATGRDVSKALQAKPDMAKMASMINRDYPALGAALGISGVSQIAQDGEQ